MTRLTTMPTDLSEMIWKDVFSESLQKVNCRYHSSKPISIYEKRISGYELFVKAQPEPRIIRDIQLKWRELDLHERQHWTSQSYILETTEKYADGTIVKY